MIKSYPENLFEEFKLLSKFPEQSHLDGIKIHQEAGSSVVDAAKSLFDKGLVSQVDGGYLTDSGRELVGNIHNILDTLNSEL